MKMVLLISLLAIAVTMDVRSYKIKNMLCVLSIVISIFLNLFSEGADSMFGYFLGMAAPFAILFPLYVLRMMGAGDIKLFCSIGALTGINNILVCIAYSFLIGLFIALGIMLMRRNFGSRLKKIYFYFKSCFLSGRIMPYEKMSAENDGRMHFSIPIAIGTIAAMII